MKTLLTLIQFAIIMLISFKGTSQTPNWQWAINGTGTGSESVNKVLTDINGNIIVSGMYVAPMTLGGTTVTTQANNAGIPFATGDLYIAKFDLNGNLTWVVYPSGVGTNLQAIILDITTDPFGNIFTYMTFNHVDSIAGNIFGNDTIYSQYSLIKFDPNGNMLWHLDLEDHLGGVIAADVSGNVYLATEFGFNTNLYSATFDTVTVTNPHPFSFGELIIVKFNGSGSALWGKTAGGIGRESVDNLLTDNAGNLYITGRYESDSMYFDANNYVLGTYPAAPASHPSDCFYAKYDSDGNLTWANSILLANMGPVPNDTYLQAALNSNSELFFAGRNVSSSLNIGSLTLNSPGYFVAKMDVNGDPVWATVIGDTLNRDPAELQLDGFGNLYVSGSFNSDSITMANTTLYNVAPGSGTRDLFVAMVDASGSPIGVFKEGGDDFDVPAFTVNANSSMYLGGTFRSNALTFGSTTLTNPNFPSNHLFLTYSTPLFTGLNDLESSENISIYPNPAQTEINLQLNNISGSPSAVSVLNPLGEVVYSRTVSNELVTTIDVSMLPSGIYMVQVQDQKSVSSGKFIKY